MTSRKAWHEMERRRKKMVIEMEMGKTASQMKRKRLERPMRRKM
jgi:hypothetical protein